MEDGSIALSYQIVKQKKVHKIWGRIKRHRLIYFMLLPSFCFVIMFSYLPVWGIIIAFYDYKPAFGIAGSTFVGLKHFQRFFNDSNFWILIRNTIAISFLRMILLTVFPIGFAVLLNELRAVKFKKFVQTVSYLPHFISFVVVATIAQTAFATGGPVNSILMSLGIISQPIIFFTVPKAFWWLVSGVNLWKGLGWSAIIYISAIVSIDPALYEAAMVDGAGRLKRIWHITIKGITPTVVVLLILEIPELLKAGFDASYLLGNSMVADFSEVLDTYVYRMGLQSGQFSYSTAIGLFTQIISLILIFSANAVAKKHSEYSLF